MRASVLAVAFGATLAVMTSGAGLAYAGDTSTAEHLFQQGIEAMKKNQFKEACDAFAGSDEADPSPGTEINLALCNEKQGKLASAWGWYRTAAGLADQRGQKERAEIARTEASKIEPKLHKLAISVKSPAEGMAVTRNGAPVPHAVLGTDVPIDPGDYTIEVKAKGKKSWSQTVHIAGTPGLDRLEVPPLVDAPADPVVTPPPSTPGREGAPAGAEGDGTKQRTIGFILGGAGIVAGIVAVSVEFLALHEKDKSTTAADAATKATNQMDKDAQNASASSHHDAAKSDELTAVVVGAGAIVLIGVGVTMVLTAPSGSKSADLRKTRVTPLLGNGTAGLGLSGSF
jgi:hypothetical protein